VSGETLPWVQDDGEADDEVPANAATHEDIGLFIRVQTAVLQHGVSSWEELPDDVLDAIWPEDDDDEAEQ